MFCGCPGQLGHGSLSPDVKWPLVGNRVEKILANLSVGEAICFLVTAFALSTRGTRWRS